MNVYKDSNFQKLLTISCLQKSIFTKRKKFLTTSQTKEYLISGLYEGVPFKKKTKKTWTLDRCKETLTVIISKFISLQNFMCDSISTVKNEGFINDMHEQSH